MQVQIATEQEMEGLGSRLASLVSQGMQIHLCGELGAGKTTLVRGFLRGMGHEGKVKSPTYTLVEPYLVNNKNIYHFDLYRLTDSEELEAIGIRDYLNSDSVCLVEWPERSQGLLHHPDLFADISIVPSGRTVELQADTEIGQNLLTSLA